ncbi:hypothetical protein CN204_04350 [Sinorhizobium meliloti]|uniref:helix-turn-helix domain-containing protein n=1 Tax=Rhizobium meliloti TaxID=382 RepID=UPI000FD95114|nr:helix-turn-helix domain-containing protein [Sinorhizobium meliloti]RVH87767.1 hypothetical protein CN204_04350 [Sinorhizobium meliloti]
MRNKNDTGQAAAEFYAKRGAWLDYLSTHSDVTHADFRVAYFIARRMNGDDQSMWWEVASMANEIGCSTKTVSVATARLQHLGLLIVVRKKRGGNRYFIRMPYEFNA